MYLTVRQAADKLAVSPWTVRKAIRDGDLPSYRFATRCLRVAESDLDDWAGRCRKLPAMREVTLKHVRMPERGGYGR